MATLIVDEEAAKKLHLIAEREQRPVDEVLRSMVESYEPHPIAEQNAALESFIGMFDDDVTDLSTTVKETLREYFKNKNDRFNRHKRAAHGGFQ